MTGRGNGAGGTLAVEAGTNPLDVKIAMSPLQWTSTKRPNKSSILMTASRLLVFLDDHLFTSIQRLGNERRETLDVGFEDRQIDRQILEIRISGQSGLSGRPTLYDIGIGHGRIPFQWFDFHHFLRLSCHRNTSFLYWIVNEVPISSPIPGKSPRELKSAERKLRFEGGNRRDFKNALGAKEVSGSPPISFYNSQRQNFFETNHRQHHFAIIRPR